MEQELLLLKNALTVFVQESCSIISGMTLYTQGYLRARLLDQDVLGPSWETYTETRLSLPRLEYDFFQNVKGLSSTGLVLATLKIAPQVSAKLAVPLEESEWVISGKTLRGAIWDAVLAPYLERCWLQHGKVIFDEQVFDQVFEQTAADVQAPGVETEIILCPIPKLKLIGPPFEFEPGLRIRPIEAEDVEVWLNPRWHWYRQPLDVGDYLHAQCAIEAVHHRQPNHYAAENILNRVNLDKEETDRISKALGTLRLMTDASLSRAFTQKTYRGLLRRRQDISYPQTPRHSPFLRWINLDEEAKVTLLKLWNGLERGDVAGEVELPFRRWQGATDRLEDADRLIDYWVGLEALFAPEASQEVKLRASLRIAAYLGETPEAWERIYKEMQHSYDWRSTVVHGGSPKKQKKLDKRSDLTKTTALTRGYLRQAILKLLESNGPLSIKPAESEISLLRRLGER